MEISKGKWEAQNFGGKENPKTRVHANNVTIANVFQIDEVQDNAKLIADAGNTYQSTNKLPSELAEANKELLEALKSILKSHRQMSFEKDGNLNDTFIETKIDSLIKNHSHA